MVLKKETKQEQSFEKRKAEVIKVLRAKKYRITDQRKMLLDIILQEDCTCPKEIYYRAAEQDPQIGVATVYRMINTLEDIGAISRKNMYQIRLECSGEDTELLLQGS